MGECFKKFINLFFKRKPKKRLPDISFVSEQCSTFKLTSSYSLIEKINSQPDAHKIKCFSIEEQQHLKKEIATVFARFIFLLKSECKSLTRDDTVFCCLVMLGIRKNTIAACMGIVNMQAITQRKFRIKIKMSETPKSKIIFKQIFKNR